MSDIDHHLGRVLHAHWRGGNRTHATHTLRQALAGDPALHAAAHARRRELEQLEKLCRGQLHRRCAVSAVHLSVLRDAMTPREEGTTDA